ncbi:nitrilase, partial [bacterium]
MTRSAKPDASAPTATPAPATLDLALWAADVAFPVAGPDAWVADLDARLAECAASGVDLLMLPEYACLRWLTYAPDDVPITGEAAWLARQADAVLPRLPDLARRHGVALLAGTMPAAGAGGTGLRNRAHLFLPDGRHAVQDKLCLTPIERDASVWAHLAAGDGVTVVAWRGLRVAVVVCLDVEQPALAALLQPQDLDLVLVPSMTSRPSGYHRVFDCAKARAVELMCPVAVVGTVGTQVRLGEATTNVAG